MSDGTTPPAWAIAMEGRLAAAIAALQVEMHQEIAEARSEARQGSADTRAGLRQEIAETRAAIMGRIDGLQESFERERLERVVDAGTADMALKRNESIRGDVNTLTDMVLSLSKVVRRMDAELRTLRGEGGA